MGSNKNKKWGKATIAGLVAAATLASPVVGAFAADGGGGSGDGTGAGDGSAGGTGKITWVYKDSFGSPTRENVKSAMGSVGVKSMDGSESNSAIDEAVNGANAECVARSKASGNQNPTCRLVSVGFVHTPDANGDWYTCKRHLRRRKMEGRIQCVRHSEQHLFVSGSQLHDPFVLL